MLSVPIITRLDNNIMLYKNRVLLKFQLSN